MIVHSKAPLRLEFAGGGTDVPPYTDTDGGLVFNATINLFTYCDIIPRSDNEIAIFCLDSCGNKNNTNNKSDFIKGIVNRMKLYTDIKGIDIVLYSDVPAGSGLGSSSSVCVALVAAISTYFKLSLTKKQIAQIAYEIERIDLGIAGGLQDQYAAVFGGFNLMEFGQNLSVTVNSYKISNDVKNELTSRLLLFNTNQIHASSNIIQKQVENISTVADIKRFYERAKFIARSMKDALINEECNTFGNLLDIAWHNKKKLCEMITNEGIDRFYEIGKNNGASGGRIMGAGNGGHFLFFSPYLVDKNKLITSLQNAGCIYVPFNFEEDGVVTWITEK